MNDTRHIPVTVSAAFLLITLLFSACTYGMPELRNPLDPAVSVGLDEVTFADPDFRDIVFNSVNDGRYETNNVYHISADGTPVSSIDGIQYLSNLNEIWMWGSSISSLEPLGQLRQVTTVYLEGANFSDLSPLTSIPTLRELQIPNVTFSDIDPLADIPLLRTLRISSTDFAGAGYSGTVESILDVTNLETIFLQQFDLSNPTSIDVFNFEPSLQTISMQECGLTVFPATERFQSLTMIDVGWNSDITSLPASPVSYPDLQILNMWGLTGLSESEWQTNLPNIVAPNLTDLHVSENNLPSVPDLSNFPDLVVIGLGNNLITDISPVTGKTSLEEINLSNNPVGNFSPLASLNGLRIAFLGNTGLTGDDLPYLAGLPNLEILEIQQNPGVTSLENIAGVTPHYFHMADSTGITQLNLNHIAHIYHVIAHAENESPSITTLIAETNPISNAVLAVLEINNQLISDISPIAAVRSLEEIRITNCAVSTGITALIGLNNLRSLEVYGNPVPQTEIDEFIAARPDVDFWY